MPKDEQTWESYRGIPILKTRRRVDGSLSFRAIGVAGIKTDLWEIEKAIDGWADVYFRTVLKMCQFKEEPKPPGDAGKSGKRESKKPRNTPPITMFEPEPPKPPEPPAGELGV